VGPLGESEGASLRRAVECVKNREGLTPGSPRAHEKETCENENACTETAAAGSRHCLLLCRRSCYVARRSQTPSGGGSPQKGSNRVSKTLKSSLPRLPSRYFGLKVVTVPVVLVPLPSTVLFPRDRRTPAPVWASPVVLSATQESAMRTVAVPDEEAPVP